MIINFNNDNSFMVSFLPEAEAVRFLDDPAVSVSFGAEQPMEAGFDAGSDFAVTFGDGGGGMNAQATQSTTRSNSTSYKSVISLTCDVSGTYDVYWSMMRSSTSGTWGSRLYIDGSSYAPANTSGWSNHVQNNLMSDVPISSGQTVEIRARTRGSSYYGYVPLLVIIQTA